MTIDSKLCTHCKEHKILTQFGIKKNGRPNSWCKNCVNIRATMYYQKKNPGARSYKDTDSLPYGRRDDPNYYRKYVWINHYNLTEERIEKILEIQNNRCVLCLSLFTEENIFSVDHDHACCPGSTSCGKCIRGFLCTSCNTGLGKLKDDVAVLTRAIQYLENNPFYDRRRS